MIGAVRRPGPLVALAVVAVALVPRIGYVLASAGGYSGTFAYDPSVYYGSAAAMLQGRWPYADFVLLHPPLAPLVLTPFAALGAVTRDSVGFVTAQIAFAVIGAINAGLVVLVARRLGVGLLGAALGGLFYALWPGSTLAEYGSRLEPLGNLFVLLGLLALTSAERTGRRRPALICGAAFGLATCVKIWWLAPLLLLLAWHLTPARRSRLGFLALGAAIPIVAINLPFFVVSPRHMVHMLVVSQFERPPQPLNFADRLSSIAGIGDVDFQPPTPVALTVAAVFAAFLVLVGRRALRHRQGPLLLALTALTLALLLVGRSYFPYYDDFPAPFLALLVAVAARRARLPERSRRRPLAVAVLAAAVVALALVDIGATRRYVLPYPADKLRPAVARSHCVMSDSPMALIELDVLTRDLAHGCRNWIDVTGHSFDMGIGRRRNRNIRWQRMLTRYLLSGDALTLFRASNTGISPELHRIVVSMRRIARDGRFAIFRTKPLPARTRRLVRHLMTHQLAPPPVP